MGPNPTQVLPPATRQKRRTGLQAQISALVEDLDRWDAAHPNGPAIIGGIRVRLRRALMSADPHLRPTRRYAVQVNISPSGKPIWIITDLIMQSDIRRCRSARQASAGSAILNGQSHAAQGAA